MCGPTSLTRNGAAGIEAGGPAALAGVSPPGTQPVSAARAKWAPD